MGLGSGSGSGSGEGTGEGLLVDVGIVESSLWFFNLMAVEIPKNSPPIIKISDILIKSNPNDNKINAMMILNNAKMILKLFPLGLLIPSIPISIVIAVLTNIRKISTDTFPGVFITVIIKIVQINTTIGIKYFKDRIFLIFVLFLT
jgi:hypothetical protein